MAQQLVPTVDGKSRRAAIEIMLNTPLVADTIRKGNVHKIKEIMASSAEHGMQTFAKALFELYARVRLVTKMPLPMRISKMIYA